MQRDTDQEAIKICFSKGSVIVSAGTASFKFAGALPGVWVSVSIRGPPRACALIHPLMQRQPGNMGNNKQFFGEQREHTDNL